MEQDAMGLTEDPSMPWVHQFSNNEQERRRFRSSLCVSLWLTLGLLWVPVIEGRSLPPKELQAAPPIRITIKPKPFEHDRIDIIKCKTLAAPIPDLNPADPEPVIEALPPDFESSVDLDGEGWLVPPPETPPPVEDSIRLNEQTPGVEPPIIIRRVQPDYPQRGLQMRIQGYVILDAVLRADGTVGAVTILQNLGKGRFGFEEKAIEAVRQWRFKPGSYRGKPADIHLTLKITFQLQ